MLYRVNNLCPSLHLLCADLAIQSAQLMTEHLEIDVNICWPLFTNCYQEWQ